MAWMATGGMVGGAVAPARPAVAGVPGARGLACGAVLGPWAPTAGAVVQKLHGAITIHVHAAPAWMGTVVPA